MAIIIFTGGATLEVQRNEKDLADLVAQALADGRPHLQFNVPGDPEGRASYVNPPAGGLHRPGQADGRSRDRMGMTAGPVVRQEERCP
jgi:hypothetical protein